MTDAGHAPPGPAGVEDIAQALMRLAPDQSVRALEALAATLANRCHAGMTDPAMGGWEALAQRTWGLREEQIRWREDEARYHLCHRVARRAACGSLADPTHGATAFHRIDVSPAWARRLLPVAVFGSFLFYRVLPTDADGLMPEERS